MNFSDDRESFESTTLDEVDLAIEVGHRDPILDIAIQAIGLLDEHDPAGRHALQRGSRAPFSSARKSACSACEMGGGLDVFEYITQDERGAEPLLKGGNSRGHSSLLASQGRTGPGGLAAVSALHG